MPNIPTLTNGAFSTSSRDTYVWNKKAEAILRKMSFRFHLAETHRTDFLGSEYSGGCFFR